LSDQHSGQTLAYLGDALIEVAVRKHLIGQGLTKVNDLHKRAIGYTSAIGQSKVALHWLEADLLSESELAVYKRGRNAVGVRKPQNAEREEYQRATGVEALMGYLHLTGNRERFLFLMADYLRVLEESEA
jgi:ribonuclease-3 family protein